MEKLTPLVSRTEPWEHTKRKRTYTTPDPSSTSRVFDRKKQCWRVFTSSLWQVTLTAAFCAALMGVYYYYWKQAKLSDSQLRNYNAVNIGLSLFLGAQLSSAFKGFAQNIRWQLLSSRYFDLKQFDMVLGCESMITSTQLLWSCRVKGRKIPSQVQWYCAISLLLNLAMQVAVAALGLVVTTEIDKLESDNRKPGRIAITDFSSVQIDSISQIYPLLPSNSSPQSIANACGLAGEAFYSNDLVTVERSDESPITKQAVYFGSLSGNFDKDAFSGVRLQDCSVVDEKNRDPGRCVPSWRIPEAEVICEAPVRSKFITAQDLLIEYGDGTETSLLWTGPSSRTTTTWASEGGLDCGPRCMMVMALVPIFNSSPDEEFYHLYNCSSTIAKTLVPPNKKEDVRTIRNAKDFQIPNAVAQTFAGAIGWGAPSSSSGDPSTYAQYPDSATFRNGSADFGIGIAYSISIFSSYSIGTMDWNGNYIIRDGYPPMDLQRLKVEWTWVILILVGLPATQLILAIIVTFLSSRAVIKDTSFIAAAQLLKPALDDLGSKGSILSGDEIADHLGKVQLCYGVKDLGSGEYFVDVVNRSDLTGYRDDGVWEPGRKMPEGHYDGPET